VNASVGCGRTPSRRPLSLLNTRHYLRSDCACRELDTTNVAVSGDVGNVEFTTPDGQSGWRDPGPVGALRVAGEPLGRHRAGRGGPASAPLPLSPYETAPPTVLSPAIWTFPELLDCKVGCDHGAALHLQGGA
jgi:hypothetical protein